MSSSTTRLYAEESTRKHLANINVEFVKSNRLALPKLLFTSPGPLPKGKYHFAHCRGEEIGRGILTSFHTLKDKYGELLAWKDKQPLPINVAASSALSVVGGAFAGAFAGILLHTMLQAYVGLQAAAYSLPGGPWVQARNYGAMVAVECGLLSIMRHIRGTPDPLSGMVAGSGGGLTLSLLLGRPPIVVLAASLYFAALNGITIKVLQACIHHRLPPPTRN